MDTDIQDRRSKMMDRVRKLLEKAASTNYDEEAKLFQQKADQLMTEWAIEEFELSRLLDGTADVRYRPEVRDVNIPRFGGDFDMQAQMSYLFSSLVKFCKCEMITLGYHNSKIFGYPGDLDYLEMLFTHLSIQMVSAMNPKPDPTKSEGENLALLKEAGLKWVDIHALMYPDVPWERRHGVRYTNVYKKFCESTGRPRQTSSALGSYQLQFATSFRLAIAERLRDIEKAREEANVGKGIVLANRQSDLKEALYELYPSMRPHPRDCDCSSCHYCNDPKCTRGCRSARRGTVRYKTMTRNQAAQTFGRQAGKNADLMQKRINS